MSEQPTTTNGATMDLKAACRVAIAALAPAAKAGVRTKLAEKYEQEWLAEIQRRREAEHEREQEKRDRKEASRERKRQRDRDRRARQRRERLLVSVKAAAARGDDAELARLIGAHDARD